MRSQLPDPLSRPVRPAVAIVIGAAIGNGLSYAVLFVLGLLFLWVLVAQGVSGNDSYAKAYESNSYLLFAHAVSFLCLLPGGAWTAKLSEASRVRNAALAGLLVALVGVLGNLVPYDLPIPLWSRLATALLPVPAFVVGALWQTRAA
jgi:hypothetical protein